MQSFYASPSQPLQLQCGLSGEMANMGTLPGSDAGESAANRCAPPGTSGPDWTSGPWQGNSRSQWSSQPWCWWHEPGGTGSEVQWATSDGRDGKPQSHYAWGTKWYAWWDYDKFDEWQSESLIRDEQSRTECSEIRLAGADRAAASSRAVHKAPKKEECDESCSSSGSDCSYSKRSRRRRDASCIQGQSTYSMPQDAEKSQQSGLRSRSVPPPQTWDSSHIPEYLLHKPQRPQRRSSSRKVYLREKSIRVCSSCHSHFSSGGARLPGAMQWACGTCLSKQPARLSEGNGGQHAPRNVDLNCAQGHPRKVHAEIHSLRSSGFNMKVLGSVMAKGFNPQILWSNLLPVEKPLIGLGEARAKWMFHYVHLNSPPGEWHSASRNCWNSDVGAGITEQPACRTGHLEINLHLKRSSVCEVQLDESRCPGPHLLHLGPCMHICLEHRTEPLAAFRCGPCSVHRSPRGPWPVAVTEWQGSDEYIQSWRWLIFMEAVTNAVADNDAKILGGVDVRWVIADDSPVIESGIFSMPTELADAHRIHFRPDDLLCIRWRHRAALLAAEQTGRAMERDDLISAVFKGLNVRGGGFLSASEIRPLAEFIGFSGDDESWQEEYASLCSYLSIDPSKGISEETFNRLVNDDSEQGCLCSNEELLKMLESGDDSESWTSNTRHDSTLSVESEVTWVAHAVVESADSFGDEMQVHFRLDCEEGTRILPGTLGDYGTPGTCRDCTVEFIPLAESYHYSVAALQALAGSPPLVQDLVLYGEVSSARSNREQLGNVQASADDLSHFKLNESQQEAVRTALAEPVTLIHGPPGTGKTRTLGALALTFARHNAARHAKGCVLYAASGNKAVDTAVQAISELCTERLEDLFQAHAGDEECCICWSEGCNVITFCGHVFHRRCLTQALRVRGAARRCPLCRSTLKSLDGIRLLRIYSSDTERLEFPVPRKYEYQGVRERMRRAVPEEMRRFALHWRIHNKVPGHHNPHAAECAAAHAELLTEDPHKEDFAGALSRYKEAVKKARAFELRSCNVLLTTSCSCRRSWVDMLLRQEGVELLQVLADEAGTTIEPEALCPMTLARDAHRLVLVGDYRQLRPVVKNRDADALGLGCSLFQRLAMSAEKRAETLSIDSDKLAAHSATHPPPVTDRADLVAAAFRKLDVGESQRLDCQSLRPFADFTGFEGSDLDWQKEYEDLCCEVGCDPACGLSLEDFRRIVDDTSDQGCHCSEDELLELAGLPRTSTGSLQLRQPGTAPASVLLRQQYRMHPQLNRFPSQQFYGGQVGDDVSTLQRPAGLLANPRNNQRCAVFFWCSPSSFHEQVQEVATRDASTQSKANPREAERCMQLTAALAARAGARSVAVLSWYNAQVTQLRTLLQSQPGCEGLHCGSVVTAQGSEWDYVLLSTVLNTSEESGEHRRRGANHGNGKLGCLADRHLLNVAVTRGRLGIVVLGSPAVLSASKHWSAFISHCEEAGGFLDSNEMPQLIAADTNSSDHNALTPQVATQAPGAQASISHALQQVRFQ